MDELLHSFVVSVALASALASISVWSPRKLWVKASAVGIAALFFVGGYATLADMMSRPKPVSLEWALRHAAQAKVLGASLREGEAIYLWLEVEGVDEPRAYALPWSLQAAQGLQAAMAQAEAEGTGVQMTLPFESGLDDREAKFYAEPQSAPPPKNHQSGGPLIYQHPESEG
jgi:hypothetical protein